MFLIHFLSGGHDGHTKHHGGIIIGTSFFEPSLVYPPVIPISYSYSSMQLASCFKDRTNGIACCCRCFILIFRSSNCENCIEKAKNRRWGLRIFLRIWFRFRVGMGSIPVSIKLPVLSAWWQQRPLTRSCRFKEWDQSINFIKNPCQLVIDQVPVYKEAWRRDVPSHACTHYGSAYSMYRIMHANGLLMCLYVRDAMLICLGDLKLSVNNFCTKRELTLALPNASKRRSALI